MNLIPQQKYLHAFIFDGRIDLADEVNPRWIFDPILAELYLLAYSAFIEKNGGPDGTREKIHTSNLHDIRKNILREALKEISNPELKIRSPGLPEALKENYFNYLHSDLRETLNNTEMTERIRSEKIIEIARLLSLTSDSNSWDMGEQVKQHLDMTIESAFTGKVIYLQNENLKRIFKEKIYPLPYIIGGRPGFCKSRVLMALVNDFHDQGLHGLFYSFEDSILTLRAKWIAMRSNVSLTTVINRSWDEHEYARIKEHNKPSNHKLSVIDKKFRFMDWLREVKTTIAARKVDYIAIDYIQLFKYNRKDERIELDDIMVGLASLVTEYAIPVIALSQLNDRDEPDGVANVHLGNLKGSGGIEEKAREVFLLEGERNSDDKIIKTAKTTLHGFVTRNIRFDGLSGKILRVDNVEK